MFQQDIAPINIFSFRSGSSSNSISGLREWPTGYAGRVWLVATSSVTKLNCGLGEPWSGITVGRTRGACEGVKTRGCCCSFCEPMHGKNHHSVCPHYASYCILQHRQSFLTGWFYTSFNSKKMLCLLWLHTSVQILICTDGAQECANVPPWAYNSWF